VSSALPARQTSETRGVLLTHHEATSPDGFSPFVTIAGFCNFCQEHKLSSGHTSSIQGFYEMVFKQLEWHSAALFYIWDNVT